MNNLLILGGRVISPQDGLDAELDIWAEDGKIRAMGSDITTPAEQILNARGMVVCPGLVDIHVHLREPGGEESETLESGLSAAVAGGFTTVCPMPNTRPVNDRPELTQAMISRAKRCGLARVHPIAAVSVASDGEILTDFVSLFSAGAVAFSDDGRPVKTAGLMKLALREAVKLGVPVIDHCEDLSLTAGGVINAGEVARRLGVRGIENISEDVCVARNLVLAAATGAHVHLAHLSTACSVGMVRAAKRYGIRVTCEATPHHFTLTEEEVERQGATAKMNTPLRRAQDRDSIVEGLADGTIDAIATDHAPHAAALKARPIEEAAFGVTGLETALALGITQLVGPRHISLPRLVELMSSGPARIIGQPHGRIRVGDTADITLFDPRREWTYRATGGKSKSSNSPFDGRKLRGAVVATVVSGNIVYRGPES